MNDIKEIDWDEMEKSMLERDARFKKTEEEGLKNLLKHFDRIHDKLFTFNNILIAGYFAIAKFDVSISKATIIIPIANLLFLIFIEYRMMEKSRFESEITQKSLESITKWGQKISRTNLYSLLTILTTSIVMGVFLYYVLK